MVEVWKQVQEGQHFLGPWGSQEEIWWFILFGRTWSLEWAPVL